MSEYKLKTTKLEKAAREAYKKIEDKFVSAFLNEDGSIKTGKMGDGVTGAYEKVEGTVVGSYKKVESAVVGSYQKVEDAFVKAFLEKIEQDEDSEDDPQNN